MAQTVLFAGAIGGTINTLFSGNVTVPANGLITVDTRDVPSLLVAGAVYIYTPFKNQTFAAPIAGAAGQIVASTALGNGTLAIANQPDVPRQCNIRIDPTTGTITAGIVTFPYTANDGTLTTDVFTCVAVAALTTQTTSKGVLIAGAPVVTALAGGTSPKIQIDTTNSLAMSVDSNYAAFTLVRTTIDGVAGTPTAVASSAASVTPSTAPNGTHNYAFAFTYSAPTN